MEKFDELIQSEKPVLVDFYATWCGPCKPTHPIIESTTAIIRDMSLNVKINVDQHRDLALRYRIQAVPTFILFKKGEVVWRHSGMSDKQNLKNIIEQNS